MNRIYILLILWTAAIPVFAQEGHDTQWVLDHFILMDFRGDTLKLSVLDDASAFAPGDFSTSISNEDGQLLFYSGGCFIFNNQNEIMENGDSINSDYAYLDFCYNGDFPFPQSNTIIPYPGNTGKYIYFNFDIIDINGITSGPLHLYYHIIDMTMDGGLGAVIEKKQIVINDTLSRGYLQAVRHTNGTDWWVVDPAWNSNCYYIIPVTSSGIGTPDLQCIGNIWNNQDGGGQSVFSPNGSKYARIESINGWSLFDFDATTGVLSNPVDLSPTNDANYFRGAAFSPNSRYLYVTATTEVFQFDLQADDIAGSMQLVGQLNPDDAFPGTGTLALQQLGPNGKIYIASPGSHKYLSVINRPNCPGILCDFHPWAIELPENNYAGLPNLPNFYIPDSDNECDSIPLAENHLNESAFKVFPNPASDKILIQSDDNILQYRIFNLLAEVQKQGKIEHKISEINIISLNPGIYFISLLNKQGETIGVQKFVVQQK